MKLIRDRIFDNPNDKKYNFLAFYVVLVVLIYRVGQRVNSPIIFRTAGVYITINYRAIHTIWFKIGLTILFEVPWY